MSEQIRKEIEKELNGLKKNVDKFTTAVDIFDEAKKLANEAGRQIDKSTKENKEILESSSTALTELLKEQSAHVELFEETITKLTELQKKTSKSDIPSNLEGINSSLAKMKDHTNKILKNQEIQFSRLSDLNTDNKKLINSLNTILKELRSADLIIKEFKEPLESQSKQLKILNSELAGKFNFLTEHLSSNYEQFESNQKKSLELQNSQNEELKKLVTSKLQALNIKASFHKNFVYGGLTLIIVLQVIILFL